jgi:hypothetical protein
MKKRVYLTCGLVLAAGIAIAIGPTTKRSHGNGHPNGVTGQTFSFLSPVSVGEKPSLIGATLTSFDEQGRSHRLKLEAVQPDPTDPAGEIALYTVLHQQADGSWQNLCQPDSEGMVQAIPLSGRWNQTGDRIDDDSITFACTNGALAKCVRWGYKPWKTVNGESLQDYHQACTRMVRADYCGDGISHTQNGIPIDVYDRLGIRRRTPDSSMTFEAAWGVDGAVQLKRTRVSKTMARLQQDCPETINHATAQSTPLAASHLVIGPRPLLFNDSFDHSERP